MGQPQLDLKPEGVAAEPVGQARFGFLLLDGFSQLAFAAAVETLAAANAAIGHAFFGWKVVTPDNSLAYSLGGISVAPDTRMDCLSRRAVLVITGGRQMAGEQRSRVIAMIRREAAHGRRLVAISDAVFLLAEAGVLEGQPCAVHWRDAAGFAERFPQLDLRVSAFVCARHSTISGCMATADFFLDHIGCSLGPNVAQVVADQITHRSARLADAPQTASQASRIGDRNATILQAVRTMEDNIATPVPVAELAGQVGISTRHLERQFLRTFGVTPLRFYLKLRLERARDLIGQTDMSLDDIAAMTGFSCLPTFLRHHRKEFGASAVGTGGKAHSVRPDLRRGAQTASISAKPRSSRNHW
jgi:AraC family transcriptional regulator, glycine betaine-responsive activator